MMFFREHPPEQKCSACGGEFWPKDAPRRVSILVAEKKKFVSKLMDGKITVYDIACVCSIECAGKLGPEWDRWKEQDVDGC